MKNEERLCALGPKTVVVTDDKNGAYALENGAFFHLPMYKDPHPPLQRTGAGDAFSSTVTAALALGLDLPTALKWGPVNSMSVVQYVGAREGLRFDRDDLTRVPLYPYGADATFV